jgi:hypothetical protein
MGQVADGSAGGASREANMPRGRPKRPAKRRTRAHVIADLSIHHVEGPILRVGFTTHRVVHDYGLDLTMTTYNRHGEPEDDYVLFQLKATDHLKRTADGSAVVCRIERVDLAGWMSQTFPVILVVYDARADVGYYLYVQAHFAASQGDFGTGQTVTVHVPVANVLDEAAIRRFAAAKAAIQGQIGGVHHA